MKTIPAGIVILELGSSLSDERRRSFFVSLDVIEGNENGLGRYGIQSLGFLWLDRELSRLRSWYCEGNLCGALDEYCLVIQLLSRRRVCVPEMWCQKCLVVKLDSVFPLFVPIPFYLNRDNVTGTWLRFSL